MRPSEWAHFSMVDLSALIVNRNNTNRCLFINLIASFFIPRKPSARIVITCDFMCCCQAVVRKCYHHSLGRIRPQFLRIEIGRLEPSSMNSLSASRISQDKRVWQLEFPSRLTLSHKPCVAS